MRINRALTAAVAGVLALTLSPAAPAGATETTTTKVERVITVKFAQVPGTEIAKFTGKAYKLKKGKAILQKKVGKNKWKKVDADKTTKTGKFVLKHRVPRSGKKTVFRVKTKADAKYLRSFSPKQIISWS